MELDDLKQRWEQADRKLDAVLRLNAAVLRQTASGRSRWAVRRFGLGLVVELVVSLAATVLIGRFLWTHGGEVRFLLPGLVLHLGAIGMLMVTVRQLNGISLLDYTAPILEIQKQLETLRVWQTRINLWVLLIAPLLWTPFLIVVFQGLFRVDPYATLPGPWLAGNFLFGLLVIVVGLWFSRRYADRVEKYPRIRRLMRDFAGANLKAARAVVDELADYEREIP